MTKYDIPDKDVIPEPAQPLHRSDASAVPLAMGGHVLAASKRRGVPDSDVASGG